MNRTIEQWMKVDCKYTAETTSAAHVSNLLQDAVNDMQELARQRDELLSALELCKYDSLNMSLAELEKVQEIYHRIKE